MILTQLEGGFSIYWGNSKMARQIAELSTYPLMELGDDPSTPIANDQM